MNNEEKILATLEQIRDAQTDLVSLHKQAAELQQKALANQVQAIQTQQQAVKSQMQQARLYKGVVAAVAILAVYLIYKLLHLQT